MTSIGDPRNLKATRHIPNEMVVAYYGWLLFAVDGFLPYVVVLTSVVVAVDAEDLLDSG